MLAILISFIGEYFIDSRTDEFKAEIEKRFKKMFKKIDGKDPVTMQDVDNIEMVDTKEEEEEKDEKKEEEKDKIISWIERIPFFKNNPILTRNFFRTAKKTFLIVFSILIYPFILFILTIPLWLIECNSFENPLNLSANNEMSNTGSITKWTYGSTIYFALTTFTTVGYGDYYPTTSNGKIYHIFLSFVGLIQFGYFVSSLGAAVKSLTDLILNIIIGLLAKILEKQPKTFKAISLGLSFANSPIPNIIIICVIFVMYYLAFSGFISLFEGWLYSEGKLFSFLIIRTLVWVHYLHYDWLRRFVSSHDWGKIFLLFWFDWRNLHCILVNISSL
jgi:hypothetical protein